MNSDRHKIVPLRGASSRAENLAEKIYQQIKSDISDFRLLPGDRFSENEIAERLQASRTPIRQALFRLQRERFVEVLHRSGWRVCPFDFDVFEELYDLRIVLELAAVRRLCEQASADDQALADLKRVWLVTKAERLADGRSVSALDERFHELLVEAAGNREMAYVHQDITARLRIIRRLDFTKAPRIHATYDEHAQILRAVLERRSDRAQLLLKSHIEESKSEVRKITLHTLHNARRLRDDD